MTEAQRYAETKGFALITTGGNCTALAYEDSNGVEWLIVKATDPEAPESFLDDSCLYADGTLYWADTLVAILNKYWPMAQTHRKSNS